MKVENEEEQLEILHEIAAERSQSGPKINDVAQSSIQKLNTEKNELLSDLLAVREDYERVCEKLNKKENECTELKLTIDNLQAKLKDMSQNKKSETKKNTENGVYDVKSIISHKIVDGELHFLIRWKNYSPEDDTWERMSNLYCKNFLNNYMKLNNLH